MCIRDSAQVVHSLAKWKRLALHRYQFSVGEGLYTDMNAIRRDEEPDNLHSVYVDQWDWEKVLAPRDRNEDYLKETVRTIVECICQTQATLRAMFPQLLSLPLVERQVTFEMCIRDSISLSFLPAAFGIVTSSVCQALGHGVLSLIVSVLRQLVLILPVSWLLGHFVGLSAVWAAFPFAEVFSFLLSAVFMGYMFKTVVRPLEQPEP